MEHKRWTLVALLMALLLVAAACGGGDDGGSSSSGDDDESTEETEDAPEEPEGQVLVEDSFDDDTNQWGPQSDDTTDAAIEDGALTFESTGDVFETVPEGLAPSPIILWPSAYDGVVPELSDTHLEATVSFTEGGVAGLACRIADVSPDSTDYRAYWSIVSSTGGVGIVQSFEDGNFESIAQNPESDPDAEPALPEDPAYDFEDGATYDIGFDCIDTDDGVELTATIDGEEIVSTVDDEDPIETGTFGVAPNASPLLHELNGYEPFRVSYDDFTAVNLGDEIDEQTIEEGAGDLEDYEAVTNGPFDDPAEPSAIIDPSEQDAQFDSLAEACFGGAFDACDQLYQQTPVGSTYETYGATCGGRIEERVNGGCQQVDEIGSNLGASPSSVIDEYGSNAQFDDLALQCGQNDLGACDELYAVTPVGSSYEAYGATCGQRSETELNGGCLPG